MLRASMGLVSRSFRVSRAFCTSGDAMKPEHEITEELVDDIHEADFKEVGSLSTMTVPDAYPDVPIIPIVRYPFFPTFIKRVDITKDEALKDALRRQMDMRQPYAGVFVRKDDESKSPIVSSLSELYNVGSFVSITEFRDLGSVIEMVLLAHRRIRILEPLTKTGRAGGGRKGRGVPSIEKTILQSATGIREAAAAARENGVSAHGVVGKTPSGIVYAKTENFIHIPAPRTNETKAKMQAIVQTIRDVVSLNPLLGQQINLLLHPTSLVIENPVNLCDLIASVIQSADTSELQAIMEEPDVSRRLDLVLELAEKEKAVAKLKHDINKDVEKKVQEQHRKYLLGEQLKVIKKELGLEKDEKSSIGEMLDERIAKIKPPEHVAKVIEEERSKLNTLEPHSAEFSVTRNYLDWLTSMPWGVESEEWRDLTKAREMLDKGHFGMEDVKQRILEFIAVNVLTKKVGGKIICLHGPPGVGKTSIAKSIAAALNRKYFRFSVGGMTDVAEIKGHRRTYVGAMPGKVIQGLKKVGTENPLVLIDEVDKMGGAGFHGDPASALLELLDPEQNAAFNDHFLDVPVDLSKVLFVCTANAIDRLPGPLRDRMELIDVSGYLAEEKTVIAQKHLIPQTRVDTCISADQLEVDQSALDTLVKKYCRESGVRMLQQSIEKIFRKAALKIASAPEGTSVDKITVTSANISDYMGKEKFASDRLYEVTPPGVVMGLAWTSMGGSALYVEAVAVPRGEKKEGGGVQITGNMGDVMKESVRIAQTVATKWLASGWNTSSWATHKDDKPEEYFERNRVHVHVPEGATPKDGPSAGVTLVSALLSLATKTPLRANLAMTGEVSLTGKVLPVGGIREKVIAARRVGATTLVFPAGNRADVDALHELVKDSLTFHFVEHYNEIVPIIFEGAEAA